MKRRELEKALLILETTPLLFAGLDGISPRRATQLRIEDVSLRDRIWSLALLEKDVWNLRIRRLLSEDSPELPAADDQEILSRAARLDGDHREALRAFGIFRGQNVRLLRQVSGKTWDRAGWIQPGGPIVLREVPSVMARLDNRNQAKLLSREVRAEDRLASRPAVLAGCCV